MKKIKSLSEFIAESMNESNTPEQLVDIELRKIKSKIETIFNYTDNSDSGNIRVMNTLQYQQQERAKKGKGTLTDFNVELVDSTMSEYSKLEPYYKAKFQDDEYMYMITFSIKTIDAIDKDKNVTPKNCDVTFKKYSLDAKFIGMLEKDIKIDEINDDFLINIKIELDEDTGSSNDKEDLGLEFEKDI